MEKLIKISKYFITTDKDIYDICDKVNENTYIVIDTILQRAYTLTILEDSNVRLELIED